MVDIILLGVLICFPLALFGAIVIFTIILNRRNKKKVVKK